MICSDSIAIDYTPRTGLTPSQAQTFDAHMTAVQTRGTSIRSEGAHLSALVNGEVNGQMAFTPSPIVQLQQALEAMMSGDRLGKLGLSESCLSYAAPRNHMAGDSIVRDSTDAAAPLGEAEHFAALFQ